MTVSICIPIHFRIEEHQTRKIETNQQEYLFDTLVHTERLKVSVGQTYYVVNQIMRLRTSWISILSQKNLFCLHSTPNQVVFINSNVSARHHM